jgi:hypothetical protein
VLVRNCHVQNFGRGDNLLVENMREWLRKSGPRYTRVNSVALARLKGFTVVKPPFLVQEPVPNFMGEYMPEDFDRLWTERLDATPSAVAAQAAEPEETPLLRLIRAHWREKRVIEGWTRERVLRLCALWSLTPAELAELIQWAPGNMTSLMSGGAIRVSGPACVWFLFLENFKCGVNVFPDLPSR